MGDEGGLWRWEDERELVCEGVYEVLFLGEGE